MAAGDAANVDLIAKLTKAADSPAQATHPGVPILGRRNDAPRGSFTTDDGDYSHIAVDDSGRVAVNVDGGSITGTFTTNAEYAEDAAHSSGDTGAFSLAVRRDADTPMAADGDYHGLVVDATGRLKVGDGGGSLTVDAASLPLPTGAATEATLADIKTAAQIIDDWDESDRAKVNPIAGQAGVAGGAGTVGATVQRVVQAADEVSYSTGVLAFGSINGSGGAYATLVTMAAPAVSLTLFNTTDQPITYSFDASTIHGYIPSRGSETIDYGAHNRKETSNVSVRYETTTVGTSGKVYGNARS